MIDECARVCIQTIFDSCGPVEQEAARDCLSMCMQVEAQKTGGVPAISGIGIGNALLRRNGCQGYTQKIKQPSKATQNQPPTFPWEGVIIGGLVLVALLAFPEGAIGGTLARCFIK